MANTKYVFRFAIVITVLLFSLTLAPIATRAADETTVEIGSASTVTGGIVKLPITVKNVVGKAGLGGYDLQVRFDPAALRITDLTAGTDPYFGAPVRNINNVEGVAYLNAFHARVPGPTGNINVAFIEVLALASGSWKLEPKITTLADTQGDNIPASPAGGTIQVAPAAAIEIGSAFLSLNRPAAVPIILRDIPRGALPASYVLKVSFSSSSLRIERLRGGDSPYDQTPAYTFDARQQAVTVTANRSGQATTQGSTTTLAYIEVVPTAADRVTATISILSLKDPAGSDIPANTIPGLLWAQPPSTVEAQPSVLTVGEYAAVSIQLKNVGSILGLGSYELEMAYNPRAITVHRVSDYPMTDRSGVQASSNIADGKVTAAGTISRRPGPVGNVSLVELIIQGLEPGQYPITINVKGLKDTAGIPLEASPKPALVTIKPVTTVQIGSASLTVGTTGKVAIAIKDYDDPEGLGNVWLDITFPQRVLEVSSISAGDVPFQSQPRQQTLGTDTPVGLITIITTPTARLKSPAEIVLAYLTVMPLAEGEFRFSLRGGSLSNSLNQPVNAKAVEGTISAKSPFKISDLAVSPRQPNLGDKATLTATITNTTGTQATYPARLWIGATLEESGNVALEPDQTRDVSFSVTRDTPGIYKAMLGEAELLFTVVNPGDLKLTNLNLSPAAPKAGEAVAVSAKIENDGKVEAIYTARLKVNQVLRDTREISVKPGEKREVTFPLASLPPGDYAIDLNGLTISFPVPGTSALPPSMFLAILAALEAIAIVLLLYKTRRPAGSQ